MDCGIKNSQIRIILNKVNLYDLLKTYAYIKTQKSFQSINIPRLPVLTTQEGIKQIKNNLDKIIEWQNISKLIPITFSNNQKMKKSGMAGILSASLELAKQGTVSIMQKKIFEKILIKKI